MGGWNADFILAFVWWAFPTTRNYHMILNFIFKIYNIVLVLPNIEMNPPQVYPDCRWARDQDAFISNSEESACRFFKYGSSSNRKIFGLLVRRLRF